VGLVRSIGVDTVETGFEERKQMTRTRFKEAKQAIRAYVRIQDDKALAVLTATAQDGKLEYMDVCKCIRGVCGGGTRVGYFAENYPLAYLAELGMGAIGRTSGSGIDGNDSLRNRIIYAICRAEQKRRGWAKVAVQLESEEIHADYETIHS
jgi:hypothetical protein